MQQNLLLEPKLKYQISGVSTKLNDPHPQVINLESNTTSQHSNTPNTHKQALNHPAESHASSIAAKSCKEFSKDTLYSKPFFKSNFKFLDKKVKSKALDILKKRKKLRNLTIVQQKL
jgi:hypothetical protein